MQSPAPPEKKRGVRWNESNLAENEIVRAEIRQSCAKIDEPKTPYHHDDEDVTDVRDTGGNRRDGHDREAGRVDGDVDCDEGWHPRQERPDAGALDPSPSPAPGLKKRERDTGRVCGKMQDAHGARDANDMDEVDDPSDDKRQPVLPPTDPRRGRTAFEDAIIAEEGEEREQELARAEKKKAFEQARRRHYGNAGLGMRLGNLLGNNHADNDGGDGDNFGDNDNIDGHPDGT